jgi:hypothetical protein
MYNAHQNNGVLTGLDASTSTNSFDVDVSSGEVFLNDSVVSASSTTVSHSTSDPEDRIDLITVNSSGTVSITQGSPAATSGEPVAPDIPTDEILVSLIYVRGGSSEILSGDIFNDYKTVLTESIPDLEANTARVETAPSNSTDVVRKNETDSIESTLADKQDSVSAGNTISETGSATGSGVLRSESFDSQGGLVIHIDVSVDITVSGSSTNDGDITLRVKDSENVTRVSKRNKNINQGDSATITINQSELAGISGTGVVEVDSNVLAAYDTLDLTGSVTGVL